MCMTKPHAPIEDGPTMRPSERLAQDLQEWQRSRSQADPETAAAQEVEAMRAAAADAAAQRRAEDTAFIFAMAAATGDRDILAPKTAPKPPETLPEIVWFLPADERRAMETAMQHAEDGRAMEWPEVEALLLDQVKARLRTESRRKSDRRTDRNRRTLVGTKQSRAFHAACQAEANRDYVSLSTWVYRVLLRELRSRQQHREREEDSENPWYGFR